MLKIASYLLLALILVSGCRRGDIPIEESEVIRDEGQGTGTTTWTSDKDYILEGFVFVNEGQTLTIEPGTVIQFRTGQAENASALIVARGGTILAEGTASDPIVFTVEGDDLMGSVPVQARGLWGGLIILGNARLNVDGEEAHIEGIPLSEPRGVYGGTLDDDNSGRLKYISIRHGGTNIGQGNEINGLTLGGVGSGTIIEYIEIISNQDDGVECFGGSVDLRYITIAYCGDDAFDADIGYHGNIQFMLAIQSPETGDKLIEITGGEPPGYGLPYTLPVIYNFTGIGRGFNSGSSIISISANGGGHIFNSVFSDQDRGVLVEKTSSEQDAYKQIERGNLAFENNIYWNVSENDSLTIFQIAADQGIDISGPSEFLKTYFTTGLNEIDHYGIGRSGESIMIRPNRSEFPNMKSYQDSWFEPVDFKGAFLNQNWILGWTLLYEEGSVVY
jgi:hypothetical protein